MGVTPNNEAITKAAVNKKSLPIAHLQKKARTINTGVSSVMLFLFLRIFTCITLPLLTFVLF
jgi:hypothetical protein